MSFNRKKTIYKVVIHLFIFILQCIEKGLALITPPYLEAIEKKSLRPSIRITVNRKLDSKDIEFAINTIETVSKMIF